MKRAIFIGFYSCYIVLILGFVLHTSSHPQILNKYTFKYFFFLIVLIGGFFPSPFFIKSVLSSRHKVSILFFIIIIIFAPAELFLRNKYKNYESNTYTYTIDNFNPFLQSQIAKQENLTVNSLGFRGEEISAKKPKNTFRIVILGGSTVLNREVPFEQNAARLLEKKLRKQYPDKKIEIINAGKDYYTSEHSLIQYMFKISDLNPDLVIMWQGVNDMLMSCLSEGRGTHGP